MGYSARMPMDNAETTGMHHDGQQGREQQRVTESLRRSLQLERFGWTASEQTVPSGLADPR